MDNKITNETKKAVLNMFKDGASKRGIAEKCGISPRSVGRIINDDSNNKDTQITSIVTDMDKILSNTSDCLNKCERYVDGVSHLMSCLYDKTDPLTAKSLNLLNDDLIRASERIVYSIERINYIKEMCKFI